jgi:hypothetical protein
MNEQLGHAELADVWIENAISAQATDETGNETLASAYAGIAQAHATLALVEQQRIANLIALAGWRADPSVEEVGTDLDQLRIGVAGEVWEGLGL